MHRGTKKVQGFQSIIKKEDILIVLRNAEKPLKNSQVRDALKILDADTYKDISFNGVKRVLLEMKKNEEIEGGYEEDLRVYLWKKKQEVEE